MPFTVGKGPNDVANPRQRKRAWKFTLFEPALLDRGDQLYVEWSAVAYCVVGRETCPTTGRAHHQGYVRFKDAKTAFAVDRLLSGKAYWTWADAGDAANTKYCSKEGNLVFTLGDRPCQGARSDIAFVRDMVAQGKSMREIIDVADVSTAALRVAEKIFAYKEIKRTWEPLVVWIWGPAGGGKSSYAKKILPNAYFIENKGRTDGTKWWQGYDAHDDVIIDDFRGSFCPFSELLALLGPSACTVENKGGSRQFLARRIIVTSAVPPEKCYNAALLGDERIDQLLRRINAIYFFEGRRATAPARQPYRGVLTDDTDSAALFRVIGENSLEPLCYTEAKVPEMACPPANTVPVLASTSTEVGGNKPGYVAPSELLPGGPPTSVLDEALFELIAESEEDGVDG